MTHRWLMGALVAAALVPALTACGGSDDKKESKDAATAAPATAAAAATREATAAPAAAATSAATRAPVAAATSAATAAPAAAATTAAGPQTMEVKAGDFFYDPKAVSFKVGAIALTMSNGGDRPHTLYVKKQGGSAELAKTDRVEPGKTATLQFTITEPGTYELYCNLPGHADRGQKATLTVTAA
jgi:uncharacterized cupredoxin-like copper-binding protein